VPAPPLPMVLPEPPGSALLQDPPHKTRSNSAERLFPLKTFSMCALSPQLDCELSESRT